MDNFEQDGFVLETNSISSMSLVKKEILEIIKKFEIEEEKYIKKVRNSEDYDKALSIFEKGKTIERLSLIIKILYNNLKGKKINDEEIDMEIRDYINDKNISKLIITLSIDCLNALLLQYNKKTAYKEMSSVPSSPMSEVLNYDMNDNKENKDILKERSR